MFTQVPGEEWASMGRDVLKQMGAGGEAHTLALAASCLLAATVELERTEADDQPDTKQAGPTAAQTRAALRAVRKAHRRFAGLCAHVCSASSRHCSL